MNKTLPAVAIAVEFLERHINEGDFDSKVRLPSIRKLASMADVSLVTMWKAAQLLKQKGAVSIVHGQGMRPIAGENHQPAAVAAARTAPVLFLLKRNGKW